ncbi:MAG: hypothetical protein K2Q26_10830 [Bdellovibrionales bacterium]|nr:hypothetical protein [Bdellovibrionales bacterium]
MNKLNSTSLLAFTVTIFGTQAAQSAPVCFELFSKIGSYSPRFAESQSPMNGIQNGQQRQQGYVLLMGFHAGRSAILGGIEYTLSQNTLKVDRVVDNPEFYGNKVYRSVLERAIQKNNHVQQILITLDQRFISANDISVLERMGTSALKDNAVVQELSSIGFSKIKDVHIFELNGRSVVSLIFERD